MLSLGAEEPSNNDVEQVMSDLRVAPPIVKAIVGEPPLMARMVRLGVGIQLTKTRYDG